MFAFVCARTADARMQLIEGSAAKQGVEIFETILEIAKFLIPFLIHDVE